MNKIVKWIQKHQDFFLKISKNNYLMAIKDGFISIMPLVMFSSLMILIVQLPTLFGIVLPDNAKLIMVKIYNLTMGIMGLMVAGTTAKALTGNFNRTMPEGKAINSTSTMIAAMSAFLFLAVSPDPKTGALDVGFLGTQGLLSAFVAAFLTVNIYKLCIKKNITIKLPKEVPGTIAQSFKDIFPFAFAVLACVLIDLISRAVVGAPFASVFQKTLTPLLKGVETYPGMCLIYGLSALFWFVGIHGPSIVMPAVTAFQLANTEANLKLFEAGQHPLHAMTNNFGNYIAAIGGTGATFIVPLVLIFFMKSKQLKTVGKASFIPVLFAVNEPLLFAAPLVLNPYMFFPFILTPICNVILGKFFIDVLGMNGMIYTLPWTVPGPIGVLLNTHFQLISIIFVIIMLVMDAAIYYPFLRVYDAELVKQETGKAQKLAEEKSFANTMKKELAKQEQEQKQKETNHSNLTKELKVLVLCAGSGTSAQLAHALNEGAKEEKMPIIANSGAYGAHYEVMANYDVVILAPQVRSFYSDMKADTDKLGIKLIATKGAEYINMTRNPKQAVNFLLSQLNLS
ncbi:MAG: PTS lactose transporter subunit IIBC [Lactobacillus mulieris]|uniref:PTS system lactose-specific EIICB component n=1 Tax=Lactobacillus mulieris TaxID=2508708 RepID=A0AAP3GX12_9LACO|nr:PTS lactose transporter subunit IIBC [Lactobacillus mulieris]MCF1783891.1 PTS lactose transporter subunit IIBC [Lactobacillus mulieris]MCT7674452.1 PTS lactose transporter subunit IIBC [Lactobacillus mulieris]MCT7772577.1 PTS lactose transporter subunit IIBC [Lactobacillus mulieris]MCW8104659.1 PTS lactose transporter subunit IIBC [Lactobacillus mulieris]MCZ3844303.1 PTS lactose transporter subunit IIBC [Lactobacillus mulieris]